MNEPGFFLDVVMDEYADAIEGASATADAAAVLAYSNGVAFAGVTKRVTHALGGPGNQTATLQTVDVNSRYRTALAVTPSRWRLRIQNRQQRTGTAGVGTIAVNAWVGTPSQGGSASFGGVYRWDGGFESAPSAVAFTAGASLVNGAEIVSDWFTGGIVAGEPIAFSVGFAFAGASCTYYGDSVGGLCRIAAGAATSASATTMSSAGGNTIVYFDARLEYEFPARQRADGRPEVEVGLLVGDSVAMGLAQDVTLIPGLIASHETWAGQAALRNKFALINAAIPATRLANGAGTGWTQVTTRAHDWLARFDLTTTIPDFAIIALGLNDCSAGTSEATQRDALQTIIANLRSFGIKRLYVATIIPGGATLPRTNDLVAPTTFACTFTNGSTQASLTAGSLRGIPLGMQISGSGVRPFSTGGYIKNVLSDTVFEMGGTASATAVGTAMTLQVAAHITSEANEYIRQGMNAHLRTCPNVNGCFDIARMIEWPLHPAWADHRYMRDYPHMLREGHQAAAIAVSL